MVEKIGAIIVLFQIRDSKTHKDLTWVQTTCERQREGKDGLSGSQSLVALLF